MREVSRSGHPLTLSKQSGAAAGPILGAIVAAGAAAAALVARRALGFSQTLRAELLKERWLPRAAATDLNQPAPVAQ